MRRAFLIYALALACSSTAAQPSPPPPPPAELSEIDHLRVENALLREQQVCRPVQEQKEAVLKDLEARYKFSVAAGDTLDRDLRKIVRKSATSPR
jgi:hypothetical protein